MGNNKVDWIKVINDIKYRSTIDTDFRALCLSDPERAIAEVSGIEVPERVNLNIIEGDPDADYTCVLPPSSDGYMLTNNDMDAVDDSRICPHNNCVMQLNEMDMDRIAGGKRCWKASCDCKGADVL